MRRSGERTPTSPKPPVAPGDVDAALRTGSNKNTPRKGRRRSSEETVGAEDSRRSSQAEEDDGSKGGAQVDGARNGSPACDAGDSDWEVLEHAGELAGLGFQVHDERAAERPLSPGVDFSTAYMVGKEGGEGARLEAGAAGDGKGEDGCCKWEDAANIHSFLVRGPTYLQVRACVNVGSIYTVRPCECLHDADTSAAVITVRS